MSDVIAPPDPLQAKRDEFYRKIGVPTGPLTKKQNKDWEKIARKEGKKTAKQEKVALKQDVAQAKAQQLYLDRRSRSEATLAAIERYRPAANVLADSFVAAHLQVDLLIEAGEKQTPPAVDWKKAFDILHAVHVSNAEEKAALAWEDGKKATRTANPALMDAADELFRRVGEERARLSDDEVARLQGQVRDAIRPVLIPSPEQKLIDGATRELEVARQALEDALDAAVANDKEARLLRGDATILLDMAAPLTVAKDAPPPLLPNKQAAELRRLLASADTARQARDYATEMDLLQTIIDTASAARGDGGPQREEWLRRKGEVAGHQSAANVLATTATSPAVQAEAAALRRRLAEIDEQKPGIGMTYAEALSRLNGAPAQLKALELEQKGFAEFTKARAAAAKRVETEFGKVEQAFGALHQAVAEATDNEHTDIADGPFRARLAALRDEWDAKLARAHSVDSLDEAGTNVAMTKLEIDIAAAARETDKLPGLVDAGLLQDARDLFDDAYDGALAAAEKLVALDSAAGAALLSALAEQRERADAATTPGGFAGPKAQVLLLQKQAIGAAAAQSDKVFGLQERLKQILAPLPGRIQDVFDKAEKIKNTAKQAPHLAMHQTLVTAYDTQRAMGRLTQVPLLERAIDEALQLEEDVAAALRALTGEKDEDGEKPLTFEKARKTLADMKSDLAGKTLDIYAKVTSFELAEQVKAVEKGLGTTSIAELQKALDELEVKIAEAKKQAEEAKKLFAAFEKDAKSITDQLKAPAFKDAPAYVKSVQGRIAGIMGNARFEGGMSGAKSEMLKLSEELTKLLEGGRDDRGVPLALAAQEAAAVAAARQAEVEKGKWEGEVKVVEKLLAAAEGIPSDEMKQLKSTLSEAKKATEKSHDYATGREQLNAVRTRLALVAENPHGLAISARNKLPQVLVRVKQAIAGLLQAFKEVQDKVEAVPDGDLNADGKKAVASQLAQLRGLFNPSVFDKPVAQAAAKDQDDKVRSGAREVALRDARRMMAYLADDFRLQVLAETPFRPAMAAPISELNLALLDLENNLLVSL
ncbi:hypothetical protein [Siccirubricoccus phaeus]|uniref:hypothetical protein n=1 Tax=Siccirubricoccus phaeus TaxID=2595053 RepID=UPI0011F2754D|nr:hypothetical protein [Siccirubricoccus phaeus]